MVTAADKIDTGQYEALMRMKPTLADTAAFFKCSPKTIQRFCEDTFKCTFTEKRDKEMVHTRHDLIRMAIARAEKSDMLLIFCLKNLCGWMSEPKQAPDNPDGQAPVMITNEQLMALVMAARGLKAV